jgi:hypothetical protein
MSLYNQLFGFDPLAKPLLGLLDIDPLHVPRFRDCFLLEGKIAVYTRTGGGNRAMNATPWIFEGEIIPRTVAPDSWDALCAAHPDFLNSEDDDYDATYAFWWFRYPVEHAALLTEMARLAGQVRPRLRWQKLMDDLKNPLLPVVKGSRSRRALQGAYVGVYQGGHLRSRERRWYVGAPSAAVAWGLFNARHQRWLRARPRHTP